MKKAFLQLHIAVLLAGLTGVLGRLITLNEGLLVWYRLFFTVIILWLSWYLLPGTRGRSGRSFWKAYLAGGVVALHWVFFYGSIKYANVSIALVCFSAVGFFTSVIDPVIMKRRFDPWELFMGILVMLGIYLIFHFDSGFKVGIVLGVISSLLAALFTVINKVLLREHDARALTFHELTGGWLILTLLLPIYLYFFPVTDLLPGWSNTGWLLVLSLFCTVLAFNLSLEALHKISPFTVNLSYNLEPVYGILLAFLIYREDRDLDKGFYYGIAIIIFTVVLQSWRVWKKKSY
ncbi:MAG TPA: DMT family transporter [Chitinophagaceae bacterium]|nr:DMT family transporter [Chitinophagaceae bacterium]